jgi:hypothetical protein
MQFATLWRIWNVSQRKKTTLQEKIVGITCGGALRPKDLVFCKYYTFQDAKKVVLACFEAKGVFGVGGPAG